MKKRKKSNKKPSIISSILGVLVFCAVLSVLQNLTPILVGIFVFGIAGCLIYILIADSPNKKASTESSRQSTQPALPSVSIIMDNTSQSYHANTAKVQSPSDNIPSDICSQTVFLWFTNRCHSTDDATNKDFYPEYFSTSYNISDPVKYYKDLVESGFYEPAGINEVLAKYKVTELKIILDSIGEKKSGNKEQLIQRIAENASPDIINSILSSSNLYTLSPKGQQFLNEHIEYVHLHEKRSTWNISFSEYEKAKKTLGGKPYTFRDVAWSVFNRQIQEIYNHKDFSNIGSIYTSMAQLLFEFDHNPKRGTFFLLEALYCEINGTTCYFNIKDYYGGYITKIELQECYCEIDIEFLADYLTDYIKYIEQTDLKRVINSVHLPYQICSDTDFISLIEELKTDNLDTEKWNTFFEKQYHKYIASLP